MKFLVLFAVVAVANASLITYPNGAVVPADEPAVAAAKAAHFAAKGLPYAAGYGLPYAAGLPYAGAYAGLPYAGYYGRPLVAHPNGAVTPAEEPAVLAARAEHFAAKGLPVAPYAAGLPVAPYATGLPYAHGYAAPAFYGLVAHPNGAVTPVDEPAVAAARAEHLKALAAAY